MTDPSDSHVPPDRAMTGAENTRMWVVTGSGFAQRLDREWLREHPSVE